MLLYFHYSLLQCNSITIYNILFNNTVNTKCLESEYRTELYQSNTRRTFMCAYTYNVSLTHPTKYHKYIRDVGPYSKCVCMMHLIIEGLSENQGYAYNQLRLVKSVTCISRESHLMGKCVIGRPRRPRYGLYLAFCVVNFICLY